MVFVGPGMTHRSIADYLDVYLHDTRGVLASTGDLDLEAAGREQGVEVDGRKRGDGDAVAEYGLLG